MLGSLDARWETIALAGSGFEDEEEGRAEVYLPDKYSTALGGLIHDICKEGALLMGIEHSDAVRVA